VTYENRLIANYAFGQLSQAASVSDVVLNSADFATALPSGLSTTTYVPVTLQDQSARIFETVWANAHTASATTATVVRGREGSTARAWPSGTLWTLAPTIRDGAYPVANRAALPTDPQVGLRAALQDEQVISEWGVAGWQYPSRTLAGRIATTAGVINGAVAGTETTITKLTVAGVRVRLGAFYEFGINLSGQASVVNDSFTLRVRRDTALTGVVVASTALITQVSNYTHSRSMVYPWRCTADNPSAPFYVSLQRGAGTGVMDVNGDRATSFWITDCGAESTVWLET
jgi:hypothetical protein